MLLAVPRDRRPASGGDDDWDLTFQTDLAPRHTLPICARSSDAPTLT